jgi:uncharacterized protein YkwD
VIPLWTALLATSATISLRDVPEQRALERALREATAVACPAATLAVDPDLTRAAAAFVAATRTGRAPPTGPALAFYAALETYEPSPVAAIARVSPAANADRAIGDLLSRECRFNRAGVAAARLSGDEAIVAVLTAAHTTDLKHVPGQVKPGTVVDVDALLAPGLASPRVFLLRPDGSVDEQRISSDGRRVRAHVTLAKRGEYTLEVLAAGAGGPQVAAIRRVFVGIEPPAAPPKEEARGDTSVQAVERAIARLRVSHGLPPLRRDPALDRVAQGHSAEMARTRTFAHVLPSDGDMSDRLRKAKYAYQVAGENIGLSLDALAAHEAVASSPAHLANLLDPHFRRIGLGAKAGRSPDGAEGVYLTEVLAASVETAADPEGEVARLLQEKRRASGLAPLARDPSLDALAAREVRTLMSESEPSAGLKRVVEEALRSQPRLRSAVAEAFVGSSAHSTDGSRNVTERGWTRIGVGATYSNADTYGRPQLWVLLLYAR